MVIIRLLASDQNESITRWPSAKDQYHSPIPLQRIRVSISAPLPRFILRTLAGDKSITQRPSAENQLSFSSPIIEDQNISLLHKCLGSLFGPLLGIIVSLAGPLPRISIILRPHYQGSVYLSPPRCLESFFGPLPGIRVLLTGPLQRINCHSPAPLPRIKISLFPTSASDHYSVPCRRSEYHLPALC